MCISALENETCLERNLTKCVFQCDSRNTWFQHHLPFSHLRQFSALHERLIQSVWTIPVLLLHRDQTEHSAPLNDANQADAHHQHLGWNWLCHLFFNPVTNKRPSQIKCSTAEVRRTGNTSCDWNNRGWNMMTDTVIYFGHSTVSQIKSTAHITRWRIRHVINWPEVGHVLPNTTTHVRNYGLTECHYAAEVDTCAVYGAEIWIISN